MKRYLVFAGDTHYPEGCWHDLAGDADTLDEAKVLISEPKFERKWRQIIDTTTGKKAEDI